MIRRRRLLLLALLAFAACAPAAAHRFVSPQLPIIRHRRLAITIPRGWRIVYRDPAHNWDSSSYEIDIGRQGPAGRAGGGDAAIEILMHALSRARRHGDLEGRAFTTAAGLHGVLHEESHFPGDHCWYLALPVPQTESAVIVRVTGLPGSRGEQERWVRGFYRTVRFVP